MLMKKLGNLETKIAPVVLGGNVFGWTIDEKQSFKILDEFIANGFNSIDTANMYSAWASGNKGGESETIIGNWMKARGNREKIILATKVGMEMGDGTSGLKKDYIVKSVDESLKRLQTDYIDLYYAHKQDTDTPLEETLSAFDELIKAGKVRIIGASNYDATQLNNALKVSKENNLTSYSVFQPQYNLYDRETFSQSLQDLTDNNNISVVSYYSLASGFLTGKYRNESDAGKSQRGQSVVASYLNQKGEKILSELDKIAREFNTTATQIS